MNISVIFGKWTQGEVLLGRARRWGILGLGAFFLGAAAWVATGPRSGIGEESRVVLRDVELVGEQDLAEAFAAGDPRLMALIDEMERAVTTGQQHRLGRFFDGEGLLSLALEGAPAEGLLVSLRGAYAKGTLNSWKKLNPLEALGEGHYQFLRVRTIAGRPGILFRLAEGDQLNYHLHQLSCDPADGYRVADTYFVGLSESLADATRRGYLHLAADARAREAGDKAASQHGNSRLFVRHMPEIGAINVAVQRGRHAEALDLYHALPQPLQADRDVMLMRVEAASQLSPLLLDEALADWKALFVREEELPLKFIDFHTARGEYEAAHVLAERVRRLTGGDSYLRVQIGELRFAMAEQAPLARSGSRTARPGTDIDPRGAEGVAQ